MIRCIRYRAFEGNTLRGFVDLEPTRIGLVLRLQLHEKNGRERVAFPVRSYEGRDGSKQWRPLTEFADGASAARKAFQEQALAALHTVAQESVPRCRS
jgi:hypothetical protein